MILNINELLFRFMVYQMNVIHYFFFYKCLLLYDHTCNVSDIQTYTRSKKVSEETIIHNWGVHT